MNLFQRIKKAFNPSSEGNFYPLTDSSYWVRNLQRSDYINLYTSRVYACVSTIWDTIAGLELVAKRNDNIVNDKALELITPDLLKAIVWHLQLTGSCYLMKNMVGSKIDSLEILRADAVTIDRDPLGFTRRYLYSRGGKQYIFQKDDLIVLYMFTPQTSYPREEKWVSPMEAVAMQVETDATSIRYNWNYFKNGASVKDVLESDQDIGEDIIQRIISKWNNKFRWVNNAHKVAVLPKWLKYKNVSPSQKEMDFVESRRFTRDEVLAIYKVPKAVIWITDNVNRATAIVAEQIFFKICIKPLATMIASKLSRELSKDDVYYEFLWVDKADNEQIMKDFQLWTITINEYRQLMWYETINWYDTLNQQTQDVIPVVESEETKNLVGDIIHKIKKKTPWTKEFMNARDSYWQKEREQKILRTDKYEAEYIKATKQIREMQQKDVLENRTKSNKVAKRWNSTKYLTMWLSLLSWPTKEMMRNEMTQAVNMIWISTAFQIWSSKLDRYIRRNITKFAKEVDMTTKQAMFDIIDQWNNQWLDTTTIAEEIRFKFQQFNLFRAKMIARTEITRASNEASQIAREENGIEKKERFTAMDERLCEFCNSMNWKVVWIKQSYWDKWDTITVWDNSMKLDYETTEHPPLHPNCRCTLLPVIE